MVSNWRLERGGIGLWIFRFGKVWDFTKPKAQWLSFVAWRGIDTNNKALGFFYGSASNKKLRDYELVITLLTNKMMNICLNLHVKFSL